MKLDLVVARYKEDISWVSKIKNKEIEIKIYNKFDGENLLPNVGREAHTYLYHIIKNYDDLADFTIFVQGNPFDHAPNFLKELEINDFQNDLCFFGNGIINCDVNSQPHGKIDNEFIPVGLHYEWLTLQKSPQFFVSIAGAQFGLSKRNIKRYTKKFYERAIKSVDYDNFTVEAHCFERSWGCLFGINLNKSYKDLRYENDANLNVKEYFQDYFKNEEIICAGKLGNYSST